jgi:hypothetical protein
MKISGALTCRRLVPACVVGVAVMLSLALPPCVAIGGMIAEAPPIDPPSGPPAGPPTGGGVPSQLPALSMFVESDGGVPYWLYPAGIEIAANKFEFRGQRTVPGQFSISYTLIVDPDPFIDAQFIVTNLSGTTRSFTLLTTLDVSPALVAPTLTGGWISGELADNNGDGATLTHRGGTANPPIYLSLIDDASFEGLYSAPQSFTAPASGSSTIPLVAFGNSPHPSHPGPAVDESIGIAVNFRLSGLDTVTLNAYFEVVPEPSSFVLAAMGLAGLAVYRWRRRK